MKYNVKTFSENAAVEDALHLYHEIGNFLMTYVKIAAGQKHEDKGLNITGKKFLEQIEAFVKKVYLNSLSKTFCCCMLMLGMKLVGIAITRNIQISPSKISWTICILISLTHFCCLL